MLPGDAKRRPQPSPPLVKAVAAFWSPTIQQIRGSDSKLNCTLQRRECRVRHAAHGWQVASARATEAGSLTAKQPALRGLFLWRGGRAGGAGSSLPGVTHGSPRRQRTPTHAEEAAYLEDNTALEHPNVNSEVQRYLSVFTIS